MKMGLVMIMYLWGALLWGSLVEMAAGDSPTDGFMQLAFSCEVQTPYDLPVSDRFSFQDDVYDLWVFSSDKPYMEDSPTMPRSELRIAGLDYTSGVWQFEADALVASPITGICIFQVFGGTQKSATALQLRVTNGTLFRYGGGLPTIPIASYIYDKWFHLNVIHDADMSTIQIFINNTLIHTETNNSYKTHYFKCGSAFTQDTTSSCLESKWKNISIWKKSSQVKGEIPLIGASGSCFPQ